MKQISYEHNINVLHNIVSEKKQDIEKKVVKFEQQQIACYGHCWNNYNYQINREKDAFYNTPNSKGVYEEQQTLKPLEAIYHILQIIHNRLNKLENQ